MTPNPPRGKGPDNRPPRGPSIKPPQMPGKTAGFWILLVFLVFLVYQMMYIDRSTVQEITFSAFKEQVRGRQHPSVDTTRT